MNKIVIGANNMPAGTPPLAYIEVARQAGYDGLGIRLHPSGGPPPPGRTRSFAPIVGDAPLMREVKRAVADSGLEMWDIFSFYIRPDMDFEAMRAAAEFGAELGAKYLLTMGDDPVWQRMVDNFGWLCDTVRPLGMTPMVEATVQQLQTMATAVKLLADAGRENAGICVDPLQIMRAEGTFEVVRGQDAPLFRYAQINDDDGSPTYNTEKCLPGDGTLPLADLFDRLPTGLPLSLEAHFPPESSLTPLEWAKMGLEKTRCFLEGYRPTSGTGEV